VPLPTYAGGSRRHSRGLLLENGVNSGKPKSSGYGNPEPSLKVEEGAETIPLGSTQGFSLGKCPAPRTGDDIVLSLLKSKGLRMFFGGAYVPHYQVIDSEKGG